MNTSLGDLTWPDVEPCGTDAVLAIPLGATEQHGPHLPLSTDTDIAIALAERLASSLENVVVAPPVAYGASGEHQEFTGTLSIGQNGVELLLLELGRSASDSFDRVVFVSAHGGNAEPLSRATLRLGEEGRRVLAWSPAWSGDAHAGRTETAVMLALRPELVRLVAAAAGNTAPIAELWPVLRSRGVRAVSGNGVLGDPSGASCEEGHALLAAATDDLVATVRSWPALPSATAAS